MSQQPAKSDRSKRMYVYWGIALSLLLGAGAFSWWVVVPAWRTHLAVRPFTEGKGFMYREEAFDALGGREEARKNLLFYARLPGWIVEPWHREAAISLLGHSLVGLDDSNSGVFLTVLSPDGRKAFISQLVSSTIWDARSGRLISTLDTPGRFEQSCEVAWSPDSRRIATTSGFYLGTYTYGATVWDAETGRETLRLEEESGVLFVAFSPDGKRLLTGGYEHHVYKSGTLAARVLIWDSATGKQLTKLELTTANELEYDTKAAFSDDGRTVRLATDKGTTTFDSGTGKEVK